MSTKQILIATTLIIVIGATITFFVLKPKPVPTDNQLTISPIPTVSTKPMLTWTDEAGFSFQYPEGTSINKHPEDTTNYANLTLTFPDQSIVQITMSDKTATNVTTATFTDNDVVVTITGTNKDIITKSWQFIYPTPTVSKTTKPLAPATDDGADVLEEE